MLWDYINILPLILLLNPLIILACDSHYCDVCQVVIFYFYHPICICALEFYCKKQLPYSINLFIHLLVSIRDFFVFHYCHHLFCCSNCSRFGHWDLSVGSWVPFLNFHHCFYFFLFWALCYFAALKEKKKGPGSSCILFVLFLE